MGGRGRGGCRGQARQVAVIHYHSTDRHLYLVHAHSTPQERCSFVSASIVISFYGNRGAFQKLPSMTRSSEDEVFRGAEEPRTPRPPRPPLASRARRIVRFQPPGRALAAASLRCARTDIYTHTRTHEKKMVWHK